MAFLGPLLAGVLPTVAGGVLGSQRARAGRRQPTQGPGALGLERTLGGIQGGPLAPEFAQGVLEAPLVQQAAATGQRQRLRAGQAAQTGRLSGAQRARLFQQAEESLSGNLLQGRLRAGVAGAQARQQERLGRERMAFEASLFAEQLAREREQEALELELQAQQQGLQVAGAGAQLGLGLAGGILGRQEQLRGFPGESPPLVQTPQLNVPGLFEGGRQPSLGLGSFG